MPALSNTHVAKLPSNRFFGLSNSQTGAVLVFQGRVFESSDFVEGREGCGSFRHTSGSLSAGKPGAYRCAGPRSILTGEMPTRALEVDRQEEFLTFCVWPTCFCEAFKRGVHSRAIAMGGVFSRKHREGFLRAELSDQLT